jgi:hypothetical protein
MHNALAGLGIYPHFWLLKNLACWKYAIESGLREFPLENMPSVSPQ